MGRSGWFLTTKVPLLNGSGKPIGLVGIARDITERKAAAQQLQQANTRLERRGMILKNIVRELKASHKELKDTQRYLIQTAKLESLGTVAAGVAHEVKNPLQTLLMGVDYLGTRFAAPDENLGVVLDDMRDAIRRANSIIGELLSLAADTDLCWVLEDLNNVVQRSLALIKSTLIAARTTVRLELATALPRLTMDRQKLQQVFINILLNGVQAMTGGGTLTVRSRMQPLDSTAARGLLFRKFKLGDTLVIVEVQDTGTGLTDAVLARVFDPFFTTKPVGSGTGLGLSVAKKIVELHGGNIDIQNAPGGGALVTVVLKV